MPRGDGTGPFGAESGTGRGMSRAGGRGRMSGNKAGSGPAGECVCPSCNTKVAHNVGVPCYSVNCPKCGAKMVRE
ncbi:MAG: DUF5320 domain-containing protein [Candidatus Kaelpia aquatica]|nr:DUF5320 domain-containing protein [Candidatus Kaelpia aquatica]